MSYGFIGGNEIRVIPIVSNGKGAMREIVRHGVNGFICDLNNWCDEVYSILRNPPDDAYLKYMSNNARETFSVHLLIMNTLKT